MGFDGAGNFNRTHNWVNDKNAGTKITASRFDAENDDFASAFGMCLVKDGQQNPNANLPMATFKHTGVGVASSRTEYVDGATYQDGAFIWAGKASGTSAITCDLNPSITAYADGLRVGFIAVGNNASAVTLNVNGVSAASFTKGKDTALDADDIVSGRATWATYVSGVGFQIIEPRGSTFVTLTTTGLATLNNILCSGSAVFTSSLNVTGPTNFTGDATVSGKAVFASAVSVAGVFIHADNTYPASAGAANQTILTDGAGALSFADPIYSPGHITGLTMSNGTDATNDIDIAVGTCVDSADAVNIALAATLAKQIDANWAVGDDAGGFPSGLSLTNDTWYHVFVIKRTDTGVVDGGFDTSLTAANLLTDASDYDAYRRVGSILRETGSNKLFFQNGDRFDWDVAVQEITGVPVTTRTLRTITTPLGIKTEAIMSTLFDTTSTGPGASYHVLYNPDMSDTTPSATFFTCYLNAHAGAFGDGDSVVRVMTDTSSRIYENASTATNLTRAFSTMGYIDTRGK